MIKLFENYFVYSPLWWNYGSLYTLDYKGEYKILFEKKKKKYCLNWKTENHRNHRKWNYAFIRNVNYYFNLHIERIITFLKGQRYTPLSVYL